MGISLKNVFPGILARSSKLWMAICNHESLKSEAVWLTTGINKSWAGSVCEKCPNTEFFSGPYLSVFSPNVGKYGPEKTPYLDTFQAVALQASKELRLIFCNCLNMTSHQVWVESFLQSRFYWNAPKEFRWPGNEWKLSKKLKYFIAKRHTFCSSCLTVWC